MELKRRPLIPIPMGKTGRPLDETLRNRIGISRESQRITIPKSLWESFGSYRHIAYYFSNYDLVIKFVPIKEGTNCATHVRIFQKRLEYKLGKVLGPLVRTGRFNWYLDNDLVVIENAIDRDKYNKLVKEEVENYRQEP